MVLLRSPTSYTKPAKTTCCGDYLWWSTVFRSTLKSRYLLPRTLIYQVRIIPNFNANTHTVASPSYTSGTGVLVLTSCILLYSKCMLTLHPSPLPIPSSSRTHTPSPLPPPPAALVLTPSHQPMTRRRRRRRRGTPRETKGSRLLH